MSWPWMKSAKAATTPISSKPDDHRPGVADLIREHQASIEQLRKQLVAAEPSLYDCAKHDDLWLLRYVLSHKGKIDPALKAAQHTLQFRLDYNLDDTDVRFESITASSNPRTQGVMEVVETPGCVNFLVPDPPRGVIAILCPGHGLNMQRLMDEVSDDDVESWFITMAEWTHQWSDYATRTTGRLTKSIRILDLQTMSLANFHRGAVQRNAKYASAMEDCYPQMLQTVFACHAPTVVQGIWRIMRPLLPQRLVVKFDFVNPEKQPKDLAKLLQYMDASVLPTRFGGSYQEWPVCIELPDVK